MQQKQRNFRLKHANHFNLKPIPPFNLAVLQRRREAFPLTPFIRFSSAAHGQERQEEEEEEDEVDSVFIEILLSVMERMRGREGSG